MPSWFCSDSWRSACIQQKLMSVGGVVTAGYALLSWPRGQDLILSSVPALACQSQDILVGRYPAESALTWFIPKIAA